MTLQNLILSQIFELREYDESSVLMFRWNAHYLIWRRWRARVKLVGDVTSNFKRAYWINFDSRCTNADLRRAIIMARADLFS